MAEKSATYKIFNGSDWDIYYFKTSAGQVGETTNLKFLHLDTHKVNNKAFTATSGITLYGTDIKVSSSNTNTIATEISSLSQGLGELEGGFDTLETGLGTLEESLAETVNELGAGISDVSSDLAIFKTTVSNTYATKTALSGYVTSAKVGTASGVASLDANGKVPTSQLPSFVDDVIEGYLSNDGKSFVNDSGATLTGETGKIYVHKGTNKTYRWSGSAYVEISSGGVALGETSSTAYAGDKGKTNATNILTLQGYFTDGIAKKATADASGNNIVSTYQPKTLSSNIVVNGNTTNANTVVGVLGNLATYINGITGTISGLGNTYATKTEVTKVSTGSTTPSNPKAGDIWLYFS